MGVRGGGDVSDTSGSLLDQGLGENRRGRGVHGVEKWSGRGVHSIRKWSDRVSHGCLSWSGGWLHYRPLLDQVHSRYRRNGCRQNRGGVDQRRVICSGSVVVRVVSGGRGVRQGELRRTLLDEVGVRQRSLVEQRRGVDHALVLSGDGGSSRSQVGRILRDRDGCRYQCTGLGGRRGEEGTQYHQLEHVGLYCLLLG